MLKSSETTVPEPGDERPIGELFSQLIDDGKAYAKAEAGLAKAIARQKANAVKLPAVLFGAAVVLILSAVNALAIGILLALSPLVGPLLAGVIAFLIFAGTAALLGWIAARKLREDL